MKLVNQTGQDVHYSISSPGGSDCGTIRSGSLVDLPGYDNQDDVVVTFRPETGYGFKTTFAQARKDSAATLVVAVE